MRRTPHRCRTGTSLRGQMARSLRRVWMTPGPRHPLGATARPGPTKPRGRCGRAAGAQLGRHRPTLVGAIDDRSVQSVVGDPCQAEQERGDPRGALHPRRARWKKWRVLAMLQEPPPRPGVIADRALDEGVPHLARRPQERVGSRLVGAVLRGVEQNVPHARGAAAGPPHQWPLFPGRAHRQPRSRPAPRRRCPGRGLSGAHRSPDRSGSWCSILPGHQIGEPLQRDLLAAWCEHLQRRHVPGQSVVQRGFERALAIAQSRATIPVARDCSTPVSARTWRISANTGARPPIPAYSESRSSAGPIGRSPSDTASGSHGPSSSRTQPSTHDQAASPTPRPALDR